MNLYRNWLDWYIPKGRKSLNPRKIRLWGSFGQGFWKESNDLSGLESRTSGLPNHYYVLNFFYDKKLTSKASKEAPKAFDLGPKNNERTSSGRDENIGNVMIFVYRDLIQKFLLNITIPIRTKFLFFQKKKLSKNTTTFSKKILVN